MPWDASTWSVAKLSKGGARLNNLEPMDEGPECTNATFTAGFYRVVRTGLSVFGLTNTALSGTQTFPVEIGTFGEPVTSVQVKANNLDRPEFTYSTNEIGLMTWTWPTEFSQNGTYSLGIEGHLLNGGSVSNQLSATVTNDNPVTFPEWFSQIFSDD